MGSLDSYLANSMAGVNFVGTPTLVQSEHAIVD